MILVTGATGLAGSHLLYKLTRNAEKVRALYRNPHSLDAVKNVFSFYTADAAVFFDRIEWIKADINDLPLLNEAFKGVTQVYHCAGLISFDERDYKKLKKINIEGTATIVNLCLAHRVRKLCHVSSIAALDERHNGGYITENAHWNPDADNSSYAITKYGAEMEVWRGVQEGLQAVVVNPGVILGAGFPESGSGKLFTTVKNGLRYYTEGVTGFVAVEDVAEAMIRLMQSSVSGERYILAAENLSYKTLLTTIAQALGVTPPEKPLKPRMLNMLRRLHRLKCRLTGRPVLLTKYTVKSVFRENRYSSARIKEALHFEFTPISAAIKNISRFMSS